MKLHKLTATFGALHGQTLTPGDGLNIIEGPNEAGKSTWAAFLRAMLYGVDTRERDRKGVIAEKNRCQPWDGSPVEGQIELTAAGRDITLRRTSRGGAPLSRFQAVYTGTEEPVPGLTADSVGEALTGVGREVFERSAFVGQSALAVTSSAELERRIGAIVSSGQEDVSFSEAERRLREWKNRRQANQKTGLIPHLEAERAEALALLERLEQANRRAAQARERLRELAEEKAELERQAQALRARAGAEAKARRDEAQAELNRAQAAWDAVRREQARRGAPPDREALREMQGELSYLNTLDANIKLARRAYEEAPEPEPAEHPVFGGMDASSARAAARADADAALALQKRWTAPKALALCLAAAALAAFAAAVWRLAPGGAPALPVCAAAGIALLLLLAVWARRGRRRKKLRRLLETYGAQGAGDILAQAEEYAARLEAAEQARAELQVRAAALERLQGEREALMSRLLAAVRPFAPEVTDPYGVSAAVSLALNLDERARAAKLCLDGAAKVVQALSAQDPPEASAPAGVFPTLGTGEVSRRLAAVEAELSRQNQALATVQGERNTLGDPAALQARLRELEEELRRRREELSAISLAMEALDEANAQLQERMSPALNARAGELFCRLTGGAYNQVSVTRDLDALASRPEDVTPRRLLLLSKGTADQLYLALRLAVCDLALPGDDPAPLVLDDALVAFDDGRLKLALELLQELAQKRQILLFTCQSRERRCLAGAANVHTLGTSD